MCAGYATTKQLLKNAIGKRFIVTIRENICSFHWPVRSAVSGFILFAMSTQRLLAASSFVSITTPTVLFRLLTTHCLVRPVSIIAPHNLLVSYAAAGGVSDLPHPESAADRASAARSITSDLAGVNQRLATCCLVDWLCKAF